MKMIVFRSRRRIARRMREDMRQALAPRWRWRPPERPERPEREGSSLSTAHGAA